MASEAVLNPLTGVARQRKRPSMLSRSAVVVGQQVSASELFRTHSSAGSSSRLPPVHRTSVFSRQKSRRAGSSVEAELAGTSNLTSTPTLGTVSQVSRSPQPSLLPFTPIAYGSPHEVSNLVNLAEGVERGSNSLVSAPSQQSGLVFMFHGSTDSFPNLECTIPFGRSATLPLNMNSLRLLRDETWAGWRREARRETRRESVEPRGESERGDCGTGDDVGQVERSDCRAERAEQDSLSVISSVSHNGSVYFDCPSQQNTPRALRIPSKASPTAESSALLETNKYENAPMLMSLNTANSAAGPMYEAQTSSAPPTECMAEKASLRPMSTSVASSEFIVDNWPSPAASDRLHRISLDKSTTSVSGWVQSGQRALSTPASEIPGGGPCSPLGAVHSPLNSSRAPVKLEDLQRILDSIQWGLPPSPSVIRPREEDQILFLLGQACCVGRDEEDPVTKPPWELLDGLWLSDGKGAQQGHFMRSQGIGICLRLSEDPSDPQQVNALRACGIQLVELHARDATDEHIVQRVLPSALMVYRHARQSGVGLVVHCNAGVNRSAAICVGLMMIEHGIRLCDAASYCSARRGDVILVNRAFRWGLALLGKALGLA
eukprot:Hpha_TRINITY_DN16802_c2_g8::TRINITY_DN16802_c2_g8_i1::g.151102::m.151102